MNMQTFPPKTANQPDPAALPSGITPLLFLQGIKVPDTEALAALTFGTTMSC